MLRTSLLMTTRRMYQPTIALMYLYQSSYAKTNMNIFYMIQLITLTIKTKRSLLMQLKTRRVKRINSRNQIFIQFNSNKLHFNVMRGINIPKFLKMFRHPMERRVKIKNLMVLLNLLVKPRSIFKIETFSTIKHMSHISNIRSIPFSNRFGK